MNSSMSTTVTTENTTIDAIPLPILNSETDKHTEEEIRSRVNVLLNNDNRVSVNDNFPYQLKEKIGDMIKYGRREVSKFPERERDLVSEIRHSMLSMYRLSIGLQKKYYKKTTLQELDIELDILRHFVRMAQDRDYYDPNVAPPLSLKKYTYWSSLLDEIGRMIGGFKKYIERVDLAKAKAKKDEKLAKFYV